MTTAPLWMLLLAGCEPLDYPAEADLLRNSSLDRLCDGYVPCDWEHEGGQLIASATWRSDDFGVSFLEGTTALRQTSRGAHDPWEPFSCVLADVMIDGEAEFHLDLDFDADGTVEWSEPLEGGSWNANRFGVEPPYWFEALTVTLRKGPEITPNVVGHVRVAGSRGEVCPRVDAPQAAGTPCRLDDHCATGRCLPADGLEEHWTQPDLEREPPPADLAVCAECATDADCADGVCGAKWGPGPLLARACVPPGEASLGEVCGADDQCASGVCCHGRCSECCEDGACEGPGGPGTCRPRQLDTDDGVRLLAVLCDAGPRDAGVVCLDDGDCAGDCSGNPLGVCATDGRRCLGDADCPQATCILAGVGEGVCQ